MHSADVEELWTTPDVAVPEARWHEGSFQRILVAFDGSMGSWKALRMGVSLAWQHDCELWVLSVKDGLPHFAAVVGEVVDEKEREDRYYGRLHQLAKELADSRGVRLRTAMVVGRAAAGILRFARNGAFDLILIGGEGRQGLWKALVGISSRVSRRASCSVMIVR